MVSVSIKYIIYTHILHKVKNSFKKSTTAIIPGDRIKDVSFFFFSLCKYSVFSKFFYQGVKIRWEKKKKYGIS